MNLKFVVNDYVLIWNLLFQASISENIHKLKQKLWLNYKEEYNCTYKDKNLILKDPKNYIPNDDTIYNIVMETKEYEKIKKSTDKYRNEILKIWDDNKKQINKELKDILRFDIDSYNIFVVNDSLNVVDSTLIKDNKQSTLIFGKRIDTEDRNKIIVDLIFEIVKREMKDYNPKYKEIVQSVLELAILNELSTRLNDRSAYLTGEATLDYLKRQIYPYWLMYLGSAKEEMLDYMMRDKIAFEIDKYTFERQLKNVDLKEFIDFCIRNQKHIIKIKEIEII
ncbi:MAG: hypothetical protein E7160_00950 [Firmicutes bacterium]|nr:hypothetical protein [Bacillota bacterium]